MNMFYYTVQCRLTGETSSFICCGEHSKAFKHSNLSVLEADEDCTCEFCPRQEKGEPASTS